MTEFSFAEICILAIVGGMAGGVWFFAICRVFDFFVKRFGKEKA